jgi:hypothetical protein
VYRKGIKEIKEGLMLIKNFKETSAGKLDVYIN